MLRRLLGLPKSESNAQQVSHIRSISGDTPPSGSSSSRSESGSPSPRSPSRSEASRVEPTSAYVEGAEAKELAEIAALRTRILIKEQNFQTDFESAFKLHMLFYKRGERDLADFFRHKAERYNYVEYSLRTMKAR